MLPQMLRAVVLALSMASAAAFGGRKAPARAAPKVIGFENELGAQAPLGFWDPLGMVAGVDQERFDRLRGVELKHGRIAQLAFLGHVTTSNGVHFNGRFLGDLEFADIKPGLAAFENLPPVGTFQIVLFIGWLETFVMRDVTGEAEFVGDFRNGFIDFGWDKFTPEQK